MRIAEDKRGYATAEVEEIVSASPERVVPRCVHFGACGGCNYQHTSYAQQLQIKETILRETLERGGVAVPEKIDVLSGDAWQYRNRLAFDAAGRIGYRGRRSHTLIPLEECPIAAPLLVEAARAVEEVLRLSARGLQPSEISFFASPDQSAMLVSVFVRSAAKAPFQKFVRALVERVPALKGAELVVEDAPQQTRRRAGTKRARTSEPRTVDRWGETSMNYVAAGRSYRVDVGAFFQVNRWLVDELVAHVTAGEQGSVAWDLFAGVGLFARALSEHFENVVAVEAAPASTAALEANLRGTSGKAVKASTAEFLRRAGTGEQPDLVVVDPPRTGLGPEVAAALVALRAPRITYVSCDPATLARDLKTLVAGGYAVERMAMADLFPQTFHLETVVHLHRA